MSIDVRFEIYTSKISISLRHVMKRDRFVVIYSMMPINIKMIKSAVNLSKSETMVIIKLITVTKNGKWCNLNIHVINLFLSRWFFFYFFEFYPETTAFFFFPTFGKVLF